MPATVTSSRPTSHDRRVTARVSRLSSRVVASSSRAAPHLAHREAHPDDCEGRHDEAEERPDRNRWVDVEAFEHLDEGLVGPEEVADVRESSPNVMVRTSTGTTHIAARVEALAAGEPEARAKPSVARWTAG